MFFGMTSVSNGGFIPKASLICLIRSERKSIKQSVSPSEQDQNKKNLTKEALTCSSLCKRKSKGLKKVKLNLTNNHIEKEKLNKETNSKLCKLVCVNLSDEWYSTFEKFNKAFQSIF